ncbi:CDP-glucose 4,6-dehydratase [Helicobacter canadensis]|uniref:CDP-glucose 4,6-dehydratase n=1 Tax=Helicobacter canadensis MIT 98-5491 TaxID=537970 RepID=C5ZW64_9HELI|nr:CDP-glucose 4,6-dehydratase [Helicobacter canadensis]EES88885.1 CDP-glucose 4,6-dehydratase [Helicobacter canadensis MIT 98-5491]EFR48808.1 CDP-glucose 4,6-dehydratase [Helicobacter canadensis MIT 98-5491]STP00155.1 NAD-dependent epimerase/dehydratase [Helicobacter canadensis]
MCFNIYKNKKIFITGHTGFKGSWLSLWLNLLGAKIYGYSLMPNTNPNHFKIINLQDKLAQNYFADINDLKKLEDAMVESDPEIIFHLAAQPLVRYSYKNPLETFQTNAMGTFNILNCARKLKSLKAIVIITTDKVYENKEWLWGYREDETLGGYDPYSASKACAEIITNSMRQSFFNVEKFKQTHQVLIASVRAGNVIGGGDWSEDRLIPDIIKGANESKTTIIRNPDSIRPWQHVLEPLCGYLALGEKLLKGEKEFATSFNFGPNNEGDLSVKNVLELATSLWNKISYEISVDLNAPHEANLLMLDISKARKILGWKPVLDSRLSIEWTIEWYKKFYENKKILTEQQLQKYGEKYHEKYFN